jgi:hypothetical protein
MKNMKRSYRRYEKEVHLKRRARNYYDYGFYGHNINWADFYEKIKLGEYDVWLRHTGTPCSCSMCSRGKYSRIPASEVRNIIDEQLE